MIAFYDMTRKELNLIGTVREINGKLVADVEPLKEFESNDPDEFFAQFSDWGNGYSASMEIPDSDEPPKELLWVEGRTWTAEEIQAAYKKHLKK